MGLLTRNKGETLLIFGTVTRDAKTFHFDNGGFVVNFSVKYGTERNADGEKSGKFMDVKAWGRGYDHITADYCACLENGDRVLVAGEYKKENKPDRDGNERWYLDAEFCMAQPTVQQADEEYPDDYGETQDDSPPKYADEDYPEVLQ